MRAAPGHPQRACLVVAPLLVLLGMAGCGADRPDDDRAGGGALVAVDAAACGRRASGLGVLVAPGLVVTNAHMVAGAEELAVVVGDGGQLMTDVVAFDPAADLAILAVDGATARPVPLGRAGDGDAAWIHTLEDGRPVAQPSEVERRIVAVGDDIYGRAGARRRVLELVAAVVGGDSGAGVFSDSGDLVGVVFARSTGDGDRAYAVDASEVREMLDDIGPDPAPVDRGPCL